MNARLPAAVAAVVLALNVAAGCGDSSGKILERITPGPPPSAHLRVDVFTAGNVLTCAAGDPCQSSNPDDCFHLTAPAAPRVAFQPETVRLVPPGDPAVAQARQSLCVRLALDAAVAAALPAALTELRNQVFELSGGDIDLEITQHAVPTIDGTFHLWDRGAFLDPPSLEPAALPVLSARTDMTFLITGTVDPDSGYTPRIEHCAGTNGELQGGLGGATYAWVAAPCATAGGLLRQAVNQLHLGLTDYSGYTNLYDSGYPACGQGVADPTAWFPWADECLLDPDGRGCGAPARCASDDEFLAHILGVHWPRGRAYVGNHCRDGRMDFDETGVDTGGVCARLGG